MAQNQNEMYWTKQLKAQGKSVPLGRFETEVHTVTEAQKKAAAERRGVGKRKNRTKQ